MRAELACCLLLAGCGVVHTLTRPEGDGGWSPARRHEELARRAAAAGVALAPAAETTPLVPEGPLDLRTALTLAQQRNGRIAEAEQLVEGARARVADTRGRLLPATTGSGRYARYTDQQTTGVSLPPGFGAPGFAPVVVVRDTEARVLNGTLTVPLDFSGELLHTLAAAQAGYRGERARQWATTLEQHVLVIRSYFRLLEAERLRDVTDQTLALQRTQEANAETRFRSGRLTKNELLVVQVALRNTEQRRLQENLATAEARWTLNQAVGLEVNAPTEPVDVRVPPAVPPVEEALRLAYATNPAVVALLEEQQRLEETATALARGWLPRLNAGGAVDYTSPEILHPQTIGSGFVGFSWDLGTDTRRQAQIAEARAAADRNRIGLERQLREVESAVRATQQATEERLAAEATAAAAVGQAEENLRIRQQQFDAGRASSEDVLDAEALLAGQRATLATALYQAHTRRAELQQLIGLPLDDVLPETR